MEHVFVKYSTNICACFFEVSCIYAASDSVACTRLVQELNKTTKTSNMFEIRAIFAFVCYTFEEAASQPF